MFFRSWHFIWTSCFQPSVWLNSMFCFNFFLFHKPFHFMRLLYDKTMLCSGHTYPKCSHRRRDQIHVKSTLYNTVKHILQCMNAGAMRTLGLCHTFSCFLPCTFWSVLLKTLFVLDSWDSVLCLNTAFSFTPHLLPLNASVPSYSNMWRQWHQSNYLTIL